MRISTFHPLPPLSEVVPDALEFFVCFIQSFWYLAAVGAPCAASWGTGVADASVTSQVSWVVQYTATEGGGGLRGAGVVGPLLCPWMLGLWASSLWVGVEDMSQGHFCSGGWVCRSQCHCCPFLCGHGCFCGPEARITCVASSMPLAGLAILTVAPGSQVPPLLFPLFYLLCVLQSTHI